MYSRVIVSFILGIDYMVVLRGANEVLITIMRSMLYVSPPITITLRRVRQCNLQKQGLIKGLLAFSLVINCMDFGLTGLCLSGLDILWPDWTYLA